MNEFELYPLKAGNVWTYQLADGSTYTNQVTAMDPATGRATMVNSTAPRPVTVFVDGEGLHSDAFEEGKFVLMLKANPQPGEAWQIKFNANGFENVLEAKVTQTGANLEVGGTNYANVVIVECESKMLVNGNWMALNFFTQYHYSPGIGLILTTSSHGDRQPLVSFSLQ